jgi:hypothetical protein
VVARQKLQPLLLYKLHLYGGLVTTEWACETKVSKLSVGEL